MTKEDISRGIVELMQEQRDLKDDLNYITGIERINTLERLSDIAEEIKSLRRRMNE